MPIIIIYILIIIQISCTSNHTKEEYTNNLKNFSSYKSKNKILLSNDTNKQNVSNNFLDTNMNGICLPVNEVFDLIEDYIGVLVLDENITMYDTIKLFRDKDTIFIILDDEKKINGFVLKCIKIDKKGFWVKYNEKDVILVRFDNPYFIFQTWRVHILSRVSNVEFNIKVNPLRKQPFYESDTIKLNNFLDIYFMPKKIYKDWLYVEWYDQKNTLCGGWIQWKNNNQLLIKLYYTC